MAENVQFLRGQLQEKEETVGNLCLELEAADERIKDLQVCMFDLQDSNAKYAVLVQEQEVRNRALEERLQQETADSMLNIYVHNKQLSQLIEARDAAVQAANDKSEGVKCGICCKPSASFAALVCEHVVCNECVSKISRCPYCRQDAVIIYKFKAWW